MPKVEVISLIYKSVSFLEFIAKQLHEHSKADGYEVSYRIIGNDPSDKVAEYLLQKNIKHSIYYDKKPADYYLNRVYRCWNYAAKTSDADIICFVNSDMAFSDGWLDNLLKHLDEKTIPVSLLIESGQLRPKYPQYQMNLGYTPKTFNQARWRQVVPSITRDTSFEGGLYMPVVFYRDEFIESGGYPEGNIYQDGKAGSMCGQIIRSGDAFFFEHILKHKKHITVCDSLVYHMQEGEMRE